MNAGPILRSPAARRGAPEAAHSSGAGSDPSASREAAFLANPEKDAVHEVVLRPMTGHSGAEILLITQGQKNFVRKSAATPEQNARLRQQSEKLRMLARYSLSVPRVLREGTHKSGCAFYDMEYVPARTVAAAICDSAAFHRSAFLKALERMFTFFKLTEGAPVSAEAFHAKIAQIKAAGRSGVCVAHCDAIAAMADRLDGLNWDGIPASEGHGDLSLENILLTADDRVVLIDCDAGWVSSWWIDAAKLYQGVSGHWFLGNLYLEDDAGRSLLHASQRLERLKPSLDSLLADLDRRLLPRIAQLAALHLFRTLPYARDERLVGFALSRIDTVLSASRT